MGNIPYTSYRGEDGLSWLYTQCFTGGWDDFVWLRLFRDGGRTQCTGRIAVLDVTEPMVRTTGSLPERIPVGTWTLT